MHGLGVKWCNLCQSAPADGVLEAILEPDTPPVKLDVCNGCYVKIPGEKWSTNEY